VSPQNQDVTSSAGSTSFSVTSNRDWTAVSDTLWCTVTTSGSGTGTITAGYTENTAHQPRIANIKVSVGGLPSQTVTLTQAKSTNGIAGSNATTFRIFPNPASSILIIECNTDLEGSRLLIIRNITGEEILRRPFQNKETVLDISAFQPGLYFVQLTTASEQTTGIKLIIQK